MRGLKCILTILKISTENAPVGDNRSSELVIPEAFIQDPEKGSEK